MADQGVLFGVHRAEPDGDLAVHEGAAVSGGREALLAQTISQLRPRDPAIPGGLLLADLALGAPRRAGGVEVLLNASFHLLCPWGSAGGEEGGGEKGPIGATRRRGRPSVAPGRAT